MDSQVLIGLLRHMSNMDTKPLHITLKTHRTKNGNSTGIFTQHSHQRLENISQSMCFLE